MVVKNKSGGLTALERRVVKKLLEKGWRNQDIQALVNLDRKATVNGGRISGVKKDQKQAPASDAELDRFLRIKRAFDSRTGLNPYRDERLIRSREAMLLAVGVFNNPTLSFKAELFCVLSNIAWTYLLHEHYLRQNIDVKKENGFTLALSEMLSRVDCPLDPATKANIEDVKKLRDKVEHSLLERADSLWGGLFQANCLNFDRVICELFGSRLSLQEELSFSLHFAKPDFEQLKQLAKHDVPPHMIALNKEMLESHDVGIREDLHYHFSVVYTMVASSKAASHFQFLTPDSQEGKEVANVLVKHKPADELYPHKPKAVVRKINKMGFRDFNISDHTAAWKRQKVRPSDTKDADQKTDRRYCIYHAAHKDWTYNDKWVDLLLEELKVPQ